MFMNLFKKDYEDIVASEVEQLLNNKQIQIIDVREQYEYKSGHIPNSKLIPLGQLPSRTNEIDKDKQVILVCASGGRSSRAAGFLSKNGFNVKNMIGGMAAWRGKLKY